MPKIKGQEARRFTDFFTDNHGRQYIGNCEIGLGTPPTTDPIDLVPRGWTAPIEPAWAKGLFVPPLDDRDVVKVLNRQDRAKAGYQIHIDYPAWLQKLDRQNEWFKERVAEIAKNMSGGVNTLQLLKDPTPELLRYVGNPPFPPRELVEAMAAGNKWALGLSSEIPPKALAVLEKIKPAVIASRQPVAETPDDPFADGGVLGNEKKDAFADINENDPLAERVA